MNEIILREPMFSEPPEDRDYKRDFVAPPPLARTLAPPFVHAWSVRSIVMGASQALHKAIASSGEPETHRS